MSPRRRGNMRRRGTPLGRHARVAAQPRRRAQRAAYARQRTPRQRLYERVFTNRGGVASAYDPMVDRATTYIYVENATARHMKAQTTIRAQRCRIPRQNARQRPPRLSPLSAQRSPLHTRKRGTVQAPHQMKHMAGWRRTNARRRKMPAIHTPAYANVQPSARRYGWQVRMVMLRSARRPPPTRR